MRQKWLDVVATIRLATCGRGTCMFVPAPQPVGFAVEPARRAIEFCTKSINGLDCFVGAMSRDEANLGKESACLERQA
jgi:hypothetical protein